MSHTCALVQSQGHEVNLELAHCICKIVETTLFTHLYGRPRTHNVHTSADVM